MAAILKFCHQINNPTLSIGV